LLGGLSNVAHAANPFIRLDNSPNGGTINYTTTNDTVSVYVRYCGSAFFTLIGQRALTTVSGGHDFAWTQTSTTTAQHVEEIKVQTNGGDWFWLDQIELFDEFGTKRWTWGVDNMDGACFSNDPSDPAPLEDPNVCFPAGSVTSKTWSNIQGWCN
jgi:hypothetical protein